MTDEKIALLEQITYIDGEVLHAAGIENLDKLPIDETMNVSSMLAMFGEKEIENLRNMGDQKLGGSWASGKEWAGIIEALKNDPELSALQVTNHQLDESGMLNLNVCYKDPTTGQGIITFKGTSGYNEWYDNCQGLTEVSTELQEKAMEFYNECAGQFEDIIVAGHSKGANKAMYVTALAEDGKISRCVAFDGPGFSNEFLQTYSDLIEQNGSKITNYAISTDFVHGLLKQLPNAEMVFCQGYGMTDPGQYHSPNSFFVIDESGKMQMDENGNPQFSITEENENIKQINGFLTYIMDNYPEDELREMGDFMGNLTGYGLGTKDGEKKALEYLISNKDKFEKMTDMIRAYGEANNLSQEDLDNFIHTFAVGNGQNIVAELVCLATRDKENYDSAFEIGEAYLNEGLVGAIPVIADEGSEILGNVIEEGADKLGDKVEEKADEISETIDQGSEDIGDKISNAGDDLGDWIEEKSEAFGAPGEVVGDILGGLSRLGGDALGGIVEFGGDVLGGAVETGGNIVDGLLDGAGELLGGAAKVVGDGLSGLAETATNVYNGAKDAFGAVKEAFSDVGSFIGEKLFGKTPATKETAENTPNQSEQQSSEQHQAAKKEKEAVEAANEDHAINQVEDQYSYPTGQTMEDVLSGLSAEGNIVIINPVIINGQVEGSTIAPSYNAGSHAEDPYVIPLDAKKILDVDPLAMGMKQPISKEDLSGVLSSQGGDIALIGDIAALFGALSEQENQLDFSEIAENWHPVVVEKYLEGKENSVDDISEKLPGIAQNLLEGQGNIETGILPLAGIQNVLPFDSSYTPYNFNSTEYKSIIMPEADNQMQATRRMAAHC
ncbi:Mbeg1-like protein [Pseudobutyrivibrio sp.]|uniref:Mbeg1-like protein n=1 Tax=Pseudobutyrivibrio sp. TaxID=2014367 RepID=UPI0025D88A9B|nr:Mbeg1-like protein [Pseudobutyrivibrio sp.]MBR5650302.1 DUF2974 domain-containing protein [Pseudobutyrivibrio sp.]